MDIITGEYIYDGYIILYIFIASVNLNTRVGIRGLKEKIRVAKMSAFNHNVNELLTDITSKYNLIVEQGILYDDIIMDIFNTLFTRKNVEFNSSVPHRHMGRREDIKT